MKYTIEYLRYILRHKWYVFVECCKLRIPLLGILHDISKLYPSEFTPYRNHFTDPRIYPQKKFDKAWNLHQKRNKHHWQYWVLVTDEDDPRLRPQEMPMKYAKEMLADWIGAGKALGKPDTLAWYEANKDKIILHHRTRAFIVDRLHDKAVKADQGQTSSLRSYKKKFWLYEDDDSR